MNTQFDKRHLIERIINRDGSTTLWAWQLLLILLVFVACSPSNETEFSEPFDLSAFLKNHVQEPPGQTIRFQILDTDGEPMSYGLLRLRWVEGGRMDFQTDQDGTLRMQFERDMLENEVLVSAKSESAKIRVTW